MPNPYKVVADFETALADYTGAPYVVCVNSCTAALQLCLMLMAPSLITLPKRTYMSVPMAAIHAGHCVAFEDFQWRGMYRLDPFNIWDCARRFTSGMYLPGQYQCVSFSSSKILGIEQGGAILHDDRLLDHWFRRMRFDGRGDGIDPLDDNFMVGLHCPMLPSIAAQGILKLHFLPRHNDDMPDYPYPDLSLQACFK